MDLIQLKLCDIQGRLFELSLQAGYESEDFMKRFMRSKVARDLDSEYNRMKAIRINAENMWTLMYRPLRKQVICGEFL